MSLLSSKIADLNLPALKTYSVNFSLDRLVPGDLIIVHTNQRSYTYIVVDTKIVLPTAVEVMEPTAQPTTTLISCYPYLKDDKRIVVIARLQVNAQASPNLFKD